MAKHGKLIRILFNEFSLSRYMKGAEQSGEAPPLETTVFESVDRQYVSDIADGKFSCEGFYHGTTNDADAYLAAALGSETQSNLLVAPEGFAAVGKRALMMLCDVAKKAVSAVATNLVMLSVEFQSSSGLNAGVILHPHEAETATGNEASHDNAASSAYGAVAQLHVTAASAGDTLTSVVQHSADNSVWVDLITFAAKTAVGTERKGVTGTVNRYTRERHTISGDGGESFTYAVGFARLKKSNY